MKLSINVPSSVPLAVIQGALAALGASIIQRKPRETQEEKEFPPLYYKKRIYCDGDNSHYLGANQEAREDKISAYIPMEMDGVSVLRAIRKIESAREAYNRSDGRNSKDFPQTGERMSTTDYVAYMESRWSLKAQA